MYICEWMDQYTYIEKTLKLCDNSRKDIAYIINCLKMSHYLLMRHDIEVKNIYNAIIGRIVLVLTPDP